MTQTIETDSAQPANPWRRTRSDGDGRTSLLFWLTMLALGGVAWGCVTWRASNLLAKKGSEKLLRVDLFLPKLNSNHTSGPLLSEQAHPMDRPTAGFHLPNLFGHSTVKVVETPHHVEPPKSTMEPPRLTSEPWWLNPFAKQTPPASVETCDEPVVYVQPCTLQRGDSPMMRTWKTVTMYSLLAAAAVTLAPPPLLAQEDKGIPAKIDGLEKLQKSVDALKKQIDDLEKKPGADREALAEIFRAELKKLEEGALGDISKNIKTLKSEMSALQTEQLKQKRQLDDLNDQVESLRKKMLAAGTGPAGTPAVDKAFMEEFRSSMKSLQDIIAKLGPIEKRDSAYPNGATAASKTGRVAIVNLYSEELFFVVNGVGYRVPARSSKMIDNVPTGALNYLVHSERWGPLESRVTTLAAGDTFTLTASNPR